MKNDRIMIIGAGINQLPAIKMAKEAGYYIVATDFDRQAVGFKVADHIGNVSTKDTEANVNYAVKLNEKFPIHGVMTMASESAVTVSKVAEALSIPGVDPIAAYRATNKIERQYWFKKNRIPSPKYAKVSNANEAIKEANRIGWPVVLKPSDSAGSRGVQLIKKESELEAAIEEIQSITNDSHFLLEEFLEGTEHSIEGIVIDGDVYWTAFSDRNYDKKYLYYPFFMEDGDTLPTVLDRATTKEVERIATNAVKALGIDFGPVKGDILIDKEGPKIIEMAARLSGDYFCYETAPLHNGINLLELVMDQAMGLPIDFERLKPKFNRGVALRYVWPKPGIVKSITGIEEVKKMPGVHFLNFEPKWKDLNVGDEIKPAKSMGERVASVLVGGETREDAVRLAEECVGKLIIKTKKK